MKTILGIIALGMSVASSSWAYEWKYELKSCVKSKGYTQGPAQIRMRIPSDMIVRFSRTDGSSPEELFQGRFNFSGGTGDDSDYTNTSMGGELLGEMNGMFIHVKGSYEKRVRYDFVVHPAGSNVADLFLDYDNAEANEKWSCRYTEI
jgi:hypothetical protein